MPDNGILFNNYEDKCPKCGGVLSFDSKFCPYCGENLEKYNEKFKEGEEQIADALYAVSKAKSRLARAEKMVEKNSYKKSSERKRLIFVKLIIIGFVLFMGIGFLGMFLEEIEDWRVENYKEKLASQSVDKIYMDPISKEEKQGFTKMSYQSAAGYVEENDNFYKIPMYSDSYSNNSIVKTTLFIDKFEAEEFDFYDSDSVYISADKFSISIHTENGSYYDRPVDAISLYYMDEEVERLNDVVINDVVFECYKFPNEYTLVANPYPDFFVTFEIRSYSSDYDFENINNVLLLKEIEFSLE